LGISEGGNVKNFREGNFIPLLDKIYPVEG
jgi:hypothetical protein